MEDTGSVPGRGRPPFGQPGADLFIGELDVEPAPLGEMAEVFAAIVEEDHDDCVPTQLFDPGTFEHLAFYEPVNHRIEMHLISKLEQEVLIPGMGLVHFAAGESIRTEISCKHDRRSVTELFTAAGLRLESWRSDPQKLFALVVGARG